MIDEANKDTSTQYLPLRVIGIIKDDTLRFMTRGSQEVIKRYDALEVQVVDSRITRAYRPTREFKVPACVSQDGGKHGHILMQAYSESLTTPTMDEIEAQLGIPDGQACQYCPFNQWGSGRDEAGNPKKGKACTERRNLLVLSDEFSIPTVISLAPTSIGNWDAYAGKFAVLKPPSHFITQRTGIKVVAVNDGGNSYGVAEFSSLGAQDIESIRQAFAVRKTFADMLGAVQAPSEEEMEDKPDVEATQEPF